MNQDDLGRQFLKESGELLEQAMIKIRHCLSQISNEQIWWRAHPTHNSIGNLLLHISGNLRQWTMSGIGGMDDKRDRDSEFASRDMVPARELLEHVQSTVTAARQLFSSLDAIRLGESRVIQGYQVTILHAVMHTTTHFVGHTHQIIQLTRIMLGESYRFQWTPDRPPGNLPV